MPARAPLLSFCNADLPSLPLPLALGMEGAGVVEAVGPKVPVGRVGTPEDIAYVYQFLASQEASYLSGELIVVDGARSLAGLD